MPAWVALRATRSRPSPVTVSTTIAAGRLRLGQVDEAEQLLDLLDRVVVREEHLQLQAVAAGCAPGVFRLEDLKLLIAAQEGRDDARHLGRRSVLEGRDAPIQLG